MVRVHVRPPFGRRPLGRLEIFGKGQGRRPATALWAGIRAASRQVENVPRAFVRGGQTHFSLKRCARRQIRRAPSFFRQAADPLGLNCTQGRPGADLGAQAARARGGCLGGGRR